MADTTADLVAAAAQRVIDDTEACGGCGSPYGPGKRYRLFDDAEAVARAYLAARPVWRAEPPDRPGWWWTRNDPCAEGEIVEVYQGNGAVELCVDDGTGWWGVGSFHKPGRQWSSGPLPSPSDPPAPEARP